ncbi:hypothetical protein [Hydrocarboniphaga sp.]|uniref:hypothetical protein n=1 Tax=Hydrocarboniphaga sp. TaxID=2033016 RepID=UPI003D0ACEF7
MPQMSFVNRLLTVAVILTFAAQIGGTLLWAGYARQWLPLHVVLGAALVLALWTSCALAMRAGAPRYRVIFAVFWGFVVIALGCFQYGQVPGARHPLLRGLHLAAGFAALMQVRYLVSCIRESIGVTSPSNKVR